VADVTSGELAEVRSMLQADGYDLLRKGLPEELVFEVIALDDACEECLIGKDMMQLVIANALGPDVSADRIRLVYPGELAAD
jgi:hypothetical protein